MQNNFHGMLSTCEKNKERRGFSSLEKYFSVYEIVISGRLHKIH